MLPPHPPAGMMIRLINCLICVMISRGRLESGMPSSDVLFFQLDGYEV